MAAATAKIPRPTQATARSPAPAPAPTGFVDSLDVENGASGWAVDTADLDRPVKVELCVGQVVVAEMATGSTRDDISIKFGRRVTAGFCFPTEIMIRLPTLAASQDDAVFVRFAGGGAAMETGIDLPTARAIAAEARLIARPAPQTEAVDLEMTLDGLRASAQPLTVATLRPTEQGLRGYIETLVVDPSGMVWFIGWMRQGHPPEFGGVLAETAKHAAAAAIMTFAREDLPGDATGIMGVLSSDWRPTQTTKDLQLYFGPGGRFHLRAHTPLRLISFKELLSDYSTIRDRCLGDRHTGALQRMLGAMESWLPGRGAGLRYGTECSVDRILLVPGLGCLAEGWIMTPMKRIEGLRMRVGAAVMTARQDALYWKPRPDLLDAFPRSETMTRRAGFVALFTGQGDTEDLADPVLKVIFEGGGSANWDIGGHVFRRLGHSATIEDALAFFPALQDEPFFPRFARAAIAIKGAAIPAPVPMRLASRARSDSAKQDVSSVMVFVLPEERCDMFLLFEEVKHGSRQAAPGAQIVFVAAATANRSDALWLFRDFEAAVSIPCSLILVDEAEHALTVLPDILRECGASRFLFAGAGIFLTRTGWLHAAEALAPQGRGLVLFAIEADQPEAAESELPAGARCFAWSATALVDWSLQAQPFFGGYHKDNGLKRADPNHIILRGAARSSRPLIASRIREAVNEAVYAQQDAA